MANSTQEQQDRVGTWIKPTGPLGGGPRLEVIQTADGTYRLTFFLLKSLKAGEGVVSADEVDEKIRTLEAQGWSRA